MAKDLNMESDSSPVKSDQDLRNNAEASRCLMISPVKKLSALRLVSPFDTDQEMIDLEVASVLAEADNCNDKHSERECSNNNSSITIHQLAAQGELNQLKHEVEQGVDIDKVDDSGLSPLLWACANGQCLTARYLLDHQADLDIVGNHGENALLFTSCYGYIDILKHLLALGMNVDYTDETGSSGLMYAAYNGHGSCVGALLEAGADLTLENENGHTAMDLTIGQGHRQVQQVIESHMLRMFDSLT
ncbi:RFXK-like protein [Mya arenaria]|uniref:RFXK-like protein n=1 Tax=Mya arenaria TaxID=6604 RepID=A0ABY7DWM5_MYAAR|nr:RFXK-like protein [Mya arenaria]